LTLENQRALAREHYQFALVADPSCAAARQGLEELGTLSTPVQLVKHSTPPAPVQPVTSKSSSLGKGHCE
jgi:hypothetical protein